MRNITLAILIIIVVALAVLSRKARASSKPIGRPVSNLMLSLIPAIAGNIVLIAPTGYAVDLSAMYVYFIGIDIIMIFLFNFALDYCKLSFDNKYFRAALAGILIVDIIQLSLNPIFGHAFGTSESIEGNVPYLHLIPRAGQNFHRTVISVILLLVLTIFIYKICITAKVYCERYIILLVAVTAAASWEMICVYKKFTFDSATVGFGIVGLLVYYFSLNYKPIFLYSRMLRTITSGMPDEMYFFDESGECIWTNGQGMELLGIDESSLYQVKQRLSELFPDANFEDPNLCGIQVINVDGVQRYYHIENHKAVEKGRRARTIGSFVSIHDNTEAQQRLDRERYIARHDTLTGLYNKDYLFTNIERALKAHPEETFLAIFVDVNEFKLVNDVFGREFGDYALKEIADWIALDMPELTYYGRLGGDTFGVCQPARLFDPNLINEKLDDFVVRKDGKEHRMLIHLGIYEIEDPDLDVSIMFDRARLALNTIKRQFSHIAYYNEDIKKTIFWNQLITTQLDEAIAKKQIVPYLQPIVNADGRVAGAEALVRWIHPDRGFLPPDRFIPEFERNGRIADIDRYMWRRACEILKEWETVHPDLFVSVNISPADFYFLNVRDEINSLVDEHGVDRRKLRLEITEAVMMSNIDERLEMITQLREDGYIVELDDFGSGYSSLNMLKEIPADVIKVDMIFLRNAKNNDKARVILSRVIDLIETLGMDSLTEGVEVERQFKALKEMGCKLFQGYYFSKPLPVEEFEEYYRKNSAEPSVIQ